MQAKLRKERELQNMLQESELLKPAISKGSSIGGKPITLLTPSTELDIGTLVPKVIRILESKSKSYNSSSRVALSGRKT